MWYSRLVETVPVWLETLKDEEGRYRLSKSAYEVSVDATSLAMDLQYMLGLPIDERSWAYLDSRQDPRNGLFNEARSPDSDEPNAHIMSGMYLGFQVCGLMQAFDRKPKYPVILFWVNQFNSVEDYLESAPWDTKPMGAGNMVDHTVTIARSSDKIYWDTFASPLIESMWEWLRQHQHFVTGLWGDVNAQGLNGLVQAGYHIVRSGYRLDEAIAENMLPVVLESMKKSNIQLDACFLLDHCFLLERLSASFPWAPSFDTWYKAIRALGEIESSLWDNGALMFSGNGAIMSHNRYKVNDPWTYEPDLVGTVLLMEAIYRIGRIINKPVPWKSSATHGMREERTWDEVATEVLEEHGELWERLANL